MPPCRKLLLPILLKATYLLACSAQGAASPNDWSRIVRLPPGTDLIVVARRPFHCELGRTDAGGILCARFLHTRFGPMDVSFEVDRSAVREVLLERTREQVAKREETMTAGAESGAAVGMLSGMAIARHDADEGRGMIGGLLAGMIAGTIVAAVVHAKHAPKPVSIYVATSQPIPPDSASGFNENDGGER